MVYPLYALPMEKYIDKPGTAFETAWRIVPTSTPLIIRHCSKCNKKMAFYCSEKFRVNANQARVDVWLIYKCQKCDSTWKLTIKKGVKPRDLQAGLFDRLVDNDRELAWLFAFDRNFLRQNACVADYSSVEYKIEGVEDFNGQMLVHLESPFIFDLKLSALLAKALGISIGRVKKLVESESISVLPAIDTMRYRIKNDLKLMFGDISC